MNKVQLLKMANSRESWRAELKWLGNAKARGHRNCVLCRTARTGLAAGLPPEQVVEAMQAAGGMAQPLTEAECRRAVMTVLATPGGGRRATQHVRPDWTAVPHMVEVGRDGKATAFDELVEQSRQACGIAHLSPREEAEVFLGTLGGGWRLFAGEDPARGRRIADTDADGFALPDPLPPRVTLNRLRPGSTRATDATAEPNYWLIEFDDMPLADQMEWLAGNWSEFQAGNPAAFDVAAGVWSGGKSVHFAVRGTNREQLARYAPQADRTVWHPCTLTRLPGAERTPGVRQRLVWLR